MDDITLDSNDYFSVAVITLTGYYFLRILPRLCNNLRDIVRYSPGEGKIYSYGENFYIQNKEEDIRLNYIQGPNLDSHVYLFLKDIEMPKNNIINPEDFKENYGNQKVIPLREFSLGFIDDIYHTKNIKHGNVYGYISLMSIHYLFWTMKKSKKFLTFSFYLNF